MHKSVNLASLTQRRVHPTEVGLRVNFVSSFIIRGEVKTSLRHLPPRTAHTGSSSKNSHLSQTFRTAHIHPKILRSPKHVRHGQRRYTLGEARAAACISRTMGRGRSCQASSFSSSDGTRSHTLKEVRARSGRTRIAAWKSAMPPSRNCCSRS
jgi:hypothetical protein